jgi:hypothetical protein
MLKQQWHHSQQLLASGQKALLSHVHVPHAPAHFSLMPSASSLPSLSSLSSWWRRKPEAGEGEAEGAEEEGNGEEGADVPEGEEGGDGRPLQRRRRQHHYAPR